MDFELAKPTRDFTKITLEDGYGAYSVQCDHIDLPLDFLMDTLVRQVLRGAGYCDKQIEEYLGA